MPQPQPARITCSQCEGWYNSERELSDHMYAVHRRFVSEPSPVPDGPKAQLGPSKDGWVILSIHLRNRVRDRFSPEELDAIDRFIRLAGQGSVFDDGRR
jgi:hypothetical protein